MRLAHITCAAGWLAEAGLICLNLVATCVTAYQRLGGIINASEAVRHRRVQIDAARHESALSDATNLAGKLS